MKKLALIFLSVFLIAWYSPFVAMQDGVSELTCQSYVEKTTTHNAEKGFGDLVGKSYVGIIFDDSSSGAICQIDFMMDGYSGTPSNLDLYVEVWLLDGSRDFVGAPISRSSKVDGTTWTNDWQAYPFSSDADYDCTGSNEYAVVIKSIDDGDPEATAAEYGTGDNSTLGYDNSANGLTGCVGIAQWDNTGAFQSVVTDDAPLIKIYTKQ